jgi:hypothetical protein
MSSSPSTFRKNDVKRAALAAAAGGIDIGRVEIDKNGVISIYPKDKTTPGKEKPAAVKPEIAL